MEEFRLEWIEKDILKIENCPKCGSEDTMPSSTSVGLVRCYGCGYVGNYMEFVVDKKR